MSFCVTILTNTVTGIIGGRGSDLLSQQRESGGYGVEIYSSNKCGWLQEKLQKLGSLQIKMHVCFLRIADFSKNPGETLRALLGSG